MTREEIEAAEKKIHVFMGDKKLTKIQNDRLVPYIPGYRYVWELLHDVISKIESMGFLFIAIGHTCQIQDRRSKMAGLETPNIIVRSNIDKKECTFLTVLAFVEWINTMNSDAPFPPPLEGYTDITLSEIKAAVKTLPNPITWDYNIYEVPFACTDMDMRFSDGNNPEDFLRVQPKVLRFVKMTKPYSRNYFWILKLD